MSAKPTPDSLRDKTAGTVDADAYARLNHVDKAIIEKDRHVVARGHRKVIMVGAGVSGITQAAMLLREKAIKHEDMVILDVQDNFGGVWDKNRYPGCACDVPALLYTNNMMINTEYDSYYATREQIFDFYVRMAHEYELERSVQFRTFVTKCTWDEDEFVWRVETESQKHGTVEEWTADVLIHAIGAFDRPKFGDTPGLDQFKGQYWHTSRWNSAVDLTGKKVAIVGCGPSAAQVIPEIIDQVDHLTVYMRTPPMVLPRNDFKRSPAWMWSMRNLPYFAYIARTLVMMQQWLFGIYLVTEGSYLNKRYTQRAHEFLEEQVKDPKLRELLRPDFSFFCKRPLFLDTLYPSLAKPNCTVVREKLKHYTEHGIVSTDRETHEYDREFDVIIFATGFNLAQYLQHETVIGHKGVNLQEQWKDHPAAIYGLATSNFPNFFYCNGPNANTFSSIHHEMNEVSAEYLSRLLKEIFMRNKDRKFAVMPNPDFEKSYNQEIQNNIGHIVTQNPACNSYYNDSTGHNTIIHHRHIWQLWWRLRSINWKEWDTIEKFGKVNEA